MVIIALQSAMVSSLLEGSSKKFGFRYLFLVFFCWDSFVYSEVAKRWLDSQELF